MSVFHEPADHLVQRPLVGHVKLLRVVGTLLFGVAAHRRSGAAAHLRDSEPQQLCAHCLGLSCRDDHAGVGNRKTDAGGEFRKGIVVDSSVKFVGIDVVRPLDAGER